MLKRVSAIFLAAALFCTSMTACGDSNEIDNAIYPIAIGVERGTNYKIRVIVQYPIYKSGGGASQDQKSGKGDIQRQNQVEGSNIHAIEASSFIEAINLLNIAISRKVSLTHAKMLVISEDFARIGIEQYVAPMRRFREIRPTMQVVVVNKDVESFIRDNKANIGESLSKSVELMLSQTKEHGFFPSATFHEFYEAMVSPYNEPYAIYAGLNNSELPPLKESSQSKVEKSSIIPDKGFLPGEIPRAGVAKREFVGSAVFSGGKMVGTLDTYETRYLLMVTGKFNRGIMTCIDKKDPQKVIPLEIRLGRNPKISAKMQNGKANINVNLKVEVDVGAIQSRIQYEDLNTIKDLNDNVKEVLENGIKKTIEKTQKDLNSDVFGFGYYVAKNFNTIQEFTDYNWLMRYQEAKINVNVEVNTRRTGLMIKSAPIMSSEKGTKGD